jgi:predicted RND superfamily exporter protein
MNWSLGFGLERLGLAVLRVPRLATLFIVLALAVCAWLIPSLKFEGDLTQTVDQTSEAFAIYQERQERFAETANSVAVVLKGDNLFTAEAFEAARNLQLDLSLEDGVRSIFSVFSLADAAEAIGQSEAGLPTDFTEPGATAPREAIAALLEDVPAAGALVAPDANAMLLLVDVEGLEVLGHSELTQRLREFETLVTELGPDNLSYDFAGRFHLRTGITDAIIADQSKLTVLAMVVGAVVAWLLFGTWRAAFVCTLAPACAVVWTLGIFAATGTPIDVLSTALPTLALIITFADTVVIYFRWQTLDTRDATDRVGNLRRAIKEIGPASSLTSITTGLAFASFALASSNAMDQFAMFGVICVAFAYFALMTAMPVMTWWTLQFAPGKRTSGAPRVGTEGPRLALLVTLAPRATVAIAVLLVAGLGWVHTQLKPSYEVRNFLPYDSSIRVSEGFVDEAFGGTSQVFAVVAAAEGGPFSAESIVRLEEVQDAMAAGFGAERTISIASADRDPAVLEDALAQASEELRNRFLSQDGELLQVTSGASAAENTAIAGQRLAAVREKISDLPYAEDVTITGLSVLLADEFPKLIGELRFGLIASVILVIASVALATRSLALAAACVIPNILPVLFTQGVIWAIGGNLSLTSVVALTIGFGISIDNSVHVINAYRTTEGSRETLVGDVRAALSEVAPALFSGTAILCVALTITLFSAMPAIAQLGGLLIGTLAAALISNIAVLPSAMILILGTRDRVKRSKEGAVV